MHDTALEIGRAAVELYGGNRPRILDLGSMDVNGSLRQFAPEDSEYIGADLEPGKGVDIVVEAGKPLPFEDGSFDLILASSVFEHDPAFWQTFLDLARVLREGGHLYISAPSNGMIHRYPEDHWRFYPDSGLALERWARSRDLPVRLIESFTAPRKNDQWNDFVAVFRRGDREDGLSDQTLHSAFQGQNAWVLGASSPANPSSDTEDMQLLTSARKDIKHLEDTKQDLEIGLKSERDDNQKLQDTRRGLENRLKDEAEQSAIELAKLRDDARARDASYLARIDALEVKVRTLEQDLSAAKDAEAEIKARFDEQGAELLNQRIETTRAESEIGVRFDELATVTRFLADTQAGRQKATDQMGWLIQVYQELDQTPDWWAALPSSMRTERKFSRLRRAGLFDAAQYLRLYPDVLEARMDPLRHYILHGMSEDRELPR
ncbi:MAG: methyltransferase domain-containing protein [Alteraurantiacibacter sp.]